MENHTTNIDLNDYIDVIRRRKYHFLISMAIVFSIAVALAFLLPSVYRSTATILIEEQEIPPDLVRSTVTSYAAERIERIAQEILQQDNLLLIAERYNLYPEYRESGLLQPISSEMKKNIKKELVSAEVRDPKYGRSTQATIAFTLSYDSNDPEVAQKVANELTDLFLQANSKARIKSAEETTAFLSAEARELNHEISQIEAEIAEFKAANADYLPELSPLNLQFMTRTENEINDLESRIQAQEERKIALQGNLAQVDPYQGLVASTGQRILTPSEQLKAKKVEFLRLSSIYSPEHPDIIKLRSEVETLEKTVGATDSTKEQFEQLALLRSQLVEKKEKYSKDHPDVIQLEKSIHNLKQAIQARSRLGVLPSNTAPPDNPAYINLQTQLLAIDSNIRAMVNQRTELKKKLAIYENRLARTPQIEKEYRTLLRDYEELKERYRDVKNKVMQAKIAQSLEEKGKGEHFSVIEPAGFPNEPIKPNRLGILLLGTVLAMGAGVAVAFVAEFLDSSIYREKQMLNILGEPPLAIIPRMEDSQTIMAAQKTKIGLMAFLTIGIVVAWVVFNNLSAQ